MGAGTPPFKAARLIPQAAEDESALLSAESCARPGYSIPKLANMAFDSAVRRKRTNAKPPSDFGAGAAA